jgi:PadR family transcriptional regulator
VAKGAHVMQGTLDLLVLKALALAPMHGWGISARIEQLSGGAFLLGQGTLYPALHRFEKRGWVTSHWRTTDNSRIARYYQLTAEGRQALVKEVMSWRQYTGAMDLVIDAR